MKNDNKERQNVLKKFNNVVVYRSKPICFIFTLQEMNLQY